MGDKGYESAGLPLIRVNPCPFVKTEKIVLSELNLSLGADHLFLIHPHLSWAEGDNLTFDFLLGPVV